jgi:hypothetical protein
LENLKELSDVNIEVKLKAIVWDGWNIGSFGPEQGLVACSCG